MKSKLLLLIAVIILQIAQIAAQPPVKPLPQADWNKNGKDTIYTMKYVAINTSSPDSAQLRVVGEIKADSMRIFGPLKVGLNSLELNAVPIGGGGSSYDEITSSFGILNFGNSTSPYSDIKIGIGNTAPVDALDVTGAIAINGFRILSAPGIPSSSNILVGHYAGASIIGGPGQGNNTFVGYSAGRNSITQNNTFIGSDAGFSNTYGIDNCFFGIDAGYSNTGAQYGIQNVYLGGSAGFYNTEGGRNTFIGHFSGYNTNGSNQSSGSLNVFLGNNSGGSNTTGNKNTYIGTSSSGLQALNNATAIGYASYVTQANSLVLGAITGNPTLEAGFTTGYYTGPTVNVGIGTTAPANRLAVGALSQFQVNHTGDLVRVNNVPYFWPAAQGLANTFLKNDGTGNLSWATVSAGIGECTAPTTLAANSGIDLNGKNFYFDGASTTGERVGVGVNCSSALTAKFNVNGNTVIGNSYIGTTTAPSNGMLVQGFTGIGPGFTSAIQPARQLDVFNSTSPQLRLTQAFPFFIAPGKYTDFQTTSSGNLRINPSVDAKLDGLQALSARTGKLQDCKKRIL